MIFNMLQFFSKKNLSFVLLIMLLMGCREKAEYFEQHDPFTKITYKNLNLHLSKDTFISVLADFYVKKSSEGLYGSVTLSFVPSFFGKDIPGIKTGDIITFELKKPDLQKETLRFVADQIEWSSTKVYDCRWRMNTAVFKLHDEQVQKIGSVMEVSYIIPTGDKPITGMLSSEQQKKILEFLNK